MLLRMRAPVFYLRYRTDIVSVNRLVVVLCASRALTMPSLNCAACKYRTFPALLDVWTTLLQYKYESGSKQWQQGGTMIVTLYCCCSSTSTCS